MRLAKTPHPSDQPLRSIWRCCGPSCRLPLCKPFVWWMLRREVRVGWTLHAGIVCKVGFRQDSCGFWVECGDHVGVRWHIEHGQGLRRHLLPSQPHLRPRQALHGRGPWGALWGMPQHLLPQQFAFLYGLAREVGSSHDIHIQKTKGFSGFIRFYTVWHGFYMVLCDCIIVLNGFTVLLDFAEFYMLSWLVNDQQNNITWKPRKSWTVETPKGCC